MKLFTKIMRAVCPRCNGTGVTAISATGSTGLRCGGTGRV